ncbi:uncharacterized protein A4U43_C04F16120 [Asparagus officinalis]|uniref:RNase H type-1 domain-containing protein n=1 Tax=Asparagus officinalis TaxID=4686 RepID=A0A5P1F1A5_ASPOF|nr:uncharacterized protein A4U43_C04F16120 [Asparagus officinalis]
MHMVLEVHMNTSKMPKSVQWRSPESGCFILNTDEAFKAGNGLAWAGGLIRDSNGCWVQGFTLNIGHTDSLSAELWGVRAGLMLAKCLSLSKVVVELDAAIVVQFLKEGIPHSHPMSIIAQDALALISDGWVTEIRYIYREGNRCADFLANLSQSCQQGVVILTEPPDDILPLLLDDFCGNPIMRL